MKNKFNPGILSLQNAKKIFLTMNISFLLIMVTVLSAHATSIFSQNANITVDMQNVTVREVVGELEKQGEISFLFNDNLAELNRRVSVSFDHTPIKDVLNSALSQADMMYEEIKDDFVVLLSKPDYLKPQDITVTGRVTDAATGDPLPGASVVVQGTTFGTITNLDGEYKIEVQDPEDIIVISFIGYMSTRITVGDQRVINVQLNFDLSLLDEVIIVGYGTQTKETLTGSVSQISGERLTNRSTSNLALALQGNLPNVNIGITNLGGEPGATQTINIRGFASITGGSPLIIVDGVEQKLETVNPSDIETISVLKDASATAIYGTRAAFGVINITTKRGQDTEGKISFSVNSNTAWNAPTNLPKYTNSVEWLTAVNQMFRNSGIDELIPSETIERCRQYLEDPSIPETRPDPSNPNQWSTWYYGNANTDWFKVFFKPWSFNQTHNISMRGGGDFANFFVSGGVFDQGGQYNYGDDRFQRYNFTANVDATITDWFSVKFNNRYTRRNIDKPYYYAWRGDTHHVIARAWPNLPVYAPDGSHLNDWLNVLDTGGRTNVHQNELINSVNAIFEPVNNWRINAELNFRQNFDTRNDHRKTVYAYFIDRTTREIGGTLPNNMAHDFIQDYYNTNNIYSSYDLTIGKHATRFLAGFQNEIYRITSLRGSRDELLLNDLPAINIATGEKYVSDNMAHWSTASFFGRVNYSYDNKYLLEIIGRYNGSSRFPEDNREAFFPAISLGYNISSEEFWSGRLAELVNFFKLRASHGETGNQDVTNYLYLPNMGIHSNLGWIRDGRRPDYITPPGLISPNIGWETVKTTNFGLDAAFFDYGLTLNFDYFRRETLDMFGPVASYPAVLGTSAPRVNNADLETKGFETEILWRNRIGDFGYQIGINFGDNVTTITRYLNDSGTLWDYYEGMKIGDIWGYTTVGIYQTDEEAQAGPDQTHFFPRWGAGDIQYADLTGDGKVTPGNNTIDDHGDLSIIGNSNPRFNYGINLGFDWRNFDLNILGQGVGKRDVAFNRGANYFWGFTGSQWTTTVFQEHLDYWRSDNPDAYYPKPYGGAENNKNNNIQSGYLQNGSYFRLKNIQIGYTLPQSVSTRLQIDQLRLYFIGENLLTFTNMASMFDPEAIGGIWGPGKIYPLAKTVSVGLNINF